MPWSKLFRKQKTVPTSQVIGASKFTDKEPAASDVDFRDKRLPYENNKLKEPRQVGTHQSPITSLVFLDDGKYIVAGYKDGSIRQWSIEGDCCEIEPPMVSDDAVTSVVVSQDGRWIASGGTDRKVTIWNAVNHQRVCESSERYRKAVSTLDTSPDSLRVAAGSEDGTVLIWSLTNGKRITGPLEHQGSQVSSVKFSPAGNRLASACTDWGCNSIRIWDSRTGNQVMSLSADNKPTYSLTWSHDGQRLFAGGPHGSIRCFNIANESISIQLRLQDHSDSVTSLCISNNDRFLVASSASNCSLDILDVDTCQSIDSTLYQTSEVLTIAISPDDRHLVSAGMDKKIMIRNLSDHVSTSYNFHRLTPSMKCSEPFTYTTKQVHAAWRHGNLEMVEEILSGEIANSGDAEFVPYLFANRALVRARMGKWDEALQDARTKSDDTYVPPAAYVAMGLSLVEQGHHRDATDAFDRARCICDDDARSFVDLIQFISQFKSGYHDEGKVIAYDTNPIECFRDVQSLRSAVKAQMLIHLAERHMKDQHFDKAIQLLSEAKNLGPFVQLPELSTISFIFGWNFDDLEIIIHQERCRAFLEGGRLRDAISSLAEIQKDLKEEVEMRSGMSEWLSGFTSRCIQASESLAEKAVRSNDHCDAVAHYSMVLELNPAFPDQILMKRSEAYAAQGLWENVLMDAEKIIARDPLLPQACDMKRRALQELGRYDELSKTISESQELAQAKMTIDETIKKTLQDAPLRMIDTQTGHLHEETGLRGVFIQDPEYMTLILSMVEPVDTARIEHVVQKFFRYVMFSHRWQGKEPLRSDVGDQSVYSLQADKIPTVIKLQTFCKTAAGAGYRWAWSDTCCIDQSNQREFEKSINSMFRWYHHSSLTLVYLWDVPPSSLPEGLTRSAWITRGWTLQELLAPPVIRFFNADWMPYLSDPRPNHKTSDVIMGEIADAVGVSANDLLSFRPSSDDVRWKLHMASKRDTTVPEDSAYCLFGIFNVVISVIPGERQYQAVGRLLQEVVNRSKSGDVGCLAWVGEPSELNSCLPTSIKAFKEPCHTPMSIGEDEIQRSVLELDPSFSNEDQARALELYKELTRRQAEFGPRGLRLPCIAFSVTALASEHSPDATNAYAVRATGLEITRICTAHRLPPKARGFLLVCPWIHELLELSDHPQRSAEDDQDSPEHPAETLAVSISGDDPKESIQPLVSHSDRAGPPDHLTAHHDHSVPTTPTSLFPPSPSAMFDERTRALRFVARLRQPTTALLLSPQQRGGYARVATDHEIVVRVHEEIRLDQIIVKEVEII